MKGRTEIWSSGGGVQSSAIAALIVLGRLPKPDIAVIADTERERSTTWDFMSKHVAHALEAVGVHIEIVKKSDWSAVDCFGGKDGETLLIPAYTTQKGQVGKLPTYCSSEWKRDVVRRWATATHGVKSANVWMGFSTDEIERAARYMSSQKNKGKWLPRFPLVDLQMSRGDCVALVRRMGWPDPPRSSCWMCPNHHMQEWREIREHPEDWPKVVQFERDIRKIDPHAWLTDQEVPIECADFSDAQEVLFGLDRGGCDSGNCFV